jgi:hypothetical protein
MVSSASDSVFSFMSFLKGFTDLILVSFRLRTLRPPFNDQGKMRDPITHIIPEDLLCLQGSLLLIIGDDLNFSDDHGLNHRVVDNHLSPPFTHCMMIFY